MGRISSYLTIQFQTPLLLSLASNSKRSVLSRFTLISQLRTQKNQRHLKHSLGEINMITVVPIHGTN